MNVELTAVFANYILPPLPLPPNCLPLWGCPCPTQLPRDIGRQQGVRQPGLLALASTYTDRKKQSNFNNYHVT